MEKVLEINSIIIALFGVSVFGGAKWFLSQFKKIMEKEKKDREVTDEAIRAILHNKIFKQGICYLERGVVEVEELNDLEKLYKPYVELGGNGTARVILENVRKLEIKRGSVYDFKRDVENAR